MKKRARSSGQMNSYFKITCAEEGNEDVKQKYIDVDAGISCKRGIQP